MQAPQPYTDCPELATTSSEQRYFAHRGESVKSARNWAHSVVRDEWRYPVEVAEVVALCVSELTTNAVVHAPHTVRGSTRGFLVALDAQADAVRIEVHDAGEALPVPREAAAEDEGGRGLLLLDALSRKWGAHPRQPFGKVVWCEVACA
jgi:anti-sigma regulatory factor (Ser/Thr protein kinase)